MTPLNRQTSRQDRERETCKITRVNHVRLFRICLLNRVHSCVTLLHPALPCLVLVPFVSLSLNVCPPQPECQMAQQLPDPIIQQTNKPPSI
ncbi:hypothetical protein K457DRAFT_576037 [Linnemannia elongata AG-77]|uniref:Uncharacterized protein n=1 Tax=Linnemannia elongata AG-77 TaxID=1314771 RepID=A0A197KGB5_9FUNG|nr:hypothetical protein K457DRAFT_576037 [Linnemannia elongata AG-77]